MVVVINGDGCVVVMKFVNIFYLVTHYLLLYACFTSSQYLTFVKPSFLPASSSTSTSDFIHSKLLGFLLYSGGTITIKG